METINRKVHFALLICIAVVTACGTSKPPTPVPTSTPIPGFVAGEEVRAWESFTEYFRSEELQDCIDPENQMDNYHYKSVDLDYKPDRALYVGDGIWRFHVQYIWIIPDEKRISLGYEATYDIRSYPDKTWENVCWSELEENYDYWDFAEPSER